MSLCKMMLSLILVVSLVTGTLSRGDYICEVSDQGKRLHESISHTQYDCVDSDCGNTCKGGQCVAYIKCRCTKKDGTYPPYTGAWSPGEKVTTADGKCNENIAANTAIATFSPGGKYSEHAGVFIKCQDDYTIQVYDQWCGSSVGYSTYDSSHRFYDAFATIQSTSSGPSYMSCRSETSGSTDCPAYVPNC